MPLGLTYRHLRHLQIVGDLHVVLYNYYSQMATNISPVAVTVQSIGSIRVYEDTLLAHLVYKCIVKMAVWLWSRIDRVPKDESERNQAWVGPVPFMRCYV